MPTPNKAVETTPETTADAFRRLRDAWLMLVGEVLSALSPAVSRLARIVTFAIQRRDLAWESRNIDREQPV